MGRKKVKTATPVKVAPPPKIYEKIDIRLRVDAELHGRIQAAADREGNSVAAFIRSAVVRELNRRERETGV